MALAINITGVFLLHSELHRIKLTSVVHLEGDIAEVCENIHHLTTQVLETCRDVLIDCEATDLLMTVIFPEQVSLHGHRHVGVFFGY